MLLAAGPRVELSRGQGWRGLPQRPLACLPRAFVLATCVPRPAYHQVTPGEVFQLFPLHGELPSQEELDALLFTDLKTG